MRKKLIAIVLIMASALGAIPLVSGCASRGLIYTLSSDGEYYLVSGYTNVSDEDFNNMQQYYSEEVDPETGEMIDPKPVTSIDVMGFFGCTRLKNIVIPDFITAIGYSAFAYCTSLENIVLPENLKTVPYGIFGGDNSLLYVDIPEGVETIANYAFYSSFLREVTIPHSVTYMGEGVFYRCDYLTKVVIYANITTVPYATFSSCQNLKEVTLPDTITEIKGYEYLNKDDKVISEDEIIPYVPGGDNDTENPNYTDNVKETIPAFYFGALDAGSDTITFEYELEKLYFLGTEEQLNKIVVGDYNVCLTESTKLTVYCWEWDETAGDYGWAEVVWNFNS